MLDASRTSYDVVVVGAGSAGMAAACAIAESGPYSVLLLERESYFGGVLRQCVHEGFGLYCFGESLTGPEYALRWKHRIEADGVQVALDTTVLDVREGDLECAGDRAGEAGKDSLAQDSSGLDAEGFQEFCQGKLESEKAAHHPGFLFNVAGVPFGGAATIHAKAVVCSTGCRERTRGSMLIPGGRPSGVLTAGSAQYMVNVVDQLPGDKVVIFGSGDIGLIMARRMVLEGAEVRMVLGQEATGLVRNHIRCIQDFGIPIRYGWGLVSIHGFGRLQGITVAPILEDGSFDMQRKEYVRCNVLLIACGLIPEREILDHLARGSEAGDRTGDSGSEPAGSDSGNAGVSGSDSDDFDGGLSGTVDSGESGDQGGTGGPSMNGDLDDAGGLGGPALSLSERYPGVFLCGNAREPHDLVDQVSQEGARAGIEAAMYLSDELGMPAPKISEDWKRFIDMKISEPHGRMREIHGELAPGDQRMVCTECPTGCVMVVHPDLTVEGNACKRGREFALREREHPMRMFTGTVRIDGAAGRVLLPVRTSRAVSKDSLLDIAKACKKVRAQAPLRAGDVVCENIAGTGSDLIATDDCSAERSSDSRGSL
ncbi:MAG: DUF1667 domain-containing protein [Coriobacteriales bacterium]|jgi:CxxC motif-containing protein